MNTLRTPLFWALRLLMITEVVLGLLFWSGRAYQLLNVHMVVGVLFTLTFFGVIAVAARRGLAFGPSVLAAAWGFVIPTFGMIQTRILVGPSHWVVRVVHLLIAVVAMRIAHTVMDATAVESPRGAEGMHEQMSS